MERALTVGERELTLAAQSLPTRIATNVTISFFGYTPGYLRDVSQRLEKLNARIGTTNLNDIFAFYKAMTIFFGVRAYELKYAEQMYLELREQLKWEIWVAEIGGRPKGVEVKVLPVMEIVRDAEKLLWWLSTSGARNGSKSLEERLTEAREEFQQSKGDYQQVTQGRGETQPCL